ncbi:hypothetical protein C0991_000294 [Blastosporella zonata]|nr:hypothetical protein C0991_000294 [Blastosporella zonata]
MTGAQIHLSEEISKNPERVVVNTRFGRVTGGRASTGAAAFLGAALSFEHSRIVSNLDLECAEIPYALPPRRFEDPVPLPIDFKYEDKETNPQTPEEYRVQFEALCRALDLDPEAPDILETLQDPVKLPWSSITHVIETDVLGTNGTFRGCLADDWLPASPDPVKWQRSGGLARGLRAHGVRSIVVGDLSEEWYLYSIAHPIPTKDDIVTNLRRYFPKDVAERFVEGWRKIPDDAGTEEVEEVFGEILSCGQVHMPVRVLAEDLYNAGFPVLRYAIEWTPEQNRTGGKWSCHTAKFIDLIKDAGRIGYVTHGTDRCIWALRQPVLEPEQEIVAKQWLDRIDVELKQIENESKPSRDVKTILTLRTTTEIGWNQDEKWEALAALRRLVITE